MEKGKIKAKKKAEIQTVKSNPISAFFNKVPGASTAEEKKIDRKEPLIPSNVEDHMENNNNNNNNNNNSKKRVKMDDDEKIKEENKENLDKEDDEFPEVDFLDVQPFFAVVLENNEQEDCKELKSQAENGGSSSSDESDDVAAKRMSKLDYMADYVSADIAAFIAKIEKLQKMTEELKPKKVKSQSKEKRPKSPSPVMSPIKGSEKAKVEEYAFSLEKMSEEVKRRNRIDLDVERFLNEIDSELDITAELEEMESQEISDPKLQRLLTMNDVFIEKYQLNMFPLWNKKTPPDLNKIELENEPSKSVKRIVELIVAASCDARFRDGFIMSGTLLEMIKEQKIETLPEIPQAVYDWLFRVLVFGWNESPLLLDAIFQILHYIISIQNKNQFHPASHFKDSSVSRRKTDLHNDSSHAVRTLLIPMSNFVKMLKGFGFKEDLTFASPSSATSPNAERVKTTVKKVVMMEAKPKAKNNQDEQDKQGKDKKDKKDEKNVGKENQEDKEGEIRSFPTRNLVYLCHLMTTMIVARTSDFTLKNIKDLISFLIKLRNDAHFANSSLLYDLETCMVSILDIIPEDSLNIEVKNLANDLLNSIEDNRPWMMLDITKNFSTASRCQKVQQQLAILFVQQMIESRLKTRPPLDFLEIDQSNSSSSILEQSHLESSPSKKRVGSKSPDKRKKLETENKLMIRQAIAEVEQNNQKGAQSGLVHILKALEEIVIDETTDYADLFLLASAFDFCLGNEHSIRKDPLLHYVLQRSREIYQSIQDPAARFMDRTKVKHIFHTLNVRLSLVRENTRITQTHMREFFNVVN